MTFQKGKSGNPTGRPGIPSHIKDLFSQHTEMAIDRLVYWAKSDQPKASVPASIYLVNRVYGAPTQPIEGGLTLVIPSNRASVVERFANRNKNK